MYGLSVKKVALCLVIFKINLDKKILFSTYNLAR